MVPRATSRRLVADSRGRSAKQPKLFPETPPDPKQREKTLTYSGDPKTKSLAWKIQSVTERDPHRSGVRLWPVRKGRKIFAARTMQRNKARNFERTL
jgi:hypothetical protein